MRAKFEVAMICVLKIDISHAREALKGESRCEMRAKHLYDNYKESPP